MHVLRQFIQTKLVDYQPSVNNLDKHSNNHNHNLCRLLPTKFDFLPLIGAILLGSGKYYSYYCQLFYFQLFYFTR